MERHLKATDQAFWRTVVSWFSTCQYGFTLLFKLCIYFKENTRMKKLCCHLLSQVLISEKNNDIPVLLMLRAEIA